MHLVMDETFCRTHHPSCRKFFFIVILKVIRNSRMEVYNKNLVKPIGKNLLRSFSFIQVEDFTKRCFPVNFANFSGSNLINSTSLTVFKHFFRSEECD